MQATHDIASLLGVSCPEKAEDIVLPMTTTVVARHFVELATMNSTYISKLSSIHNKYGMDVDLEKDVVGPLRNELSWWGASHTGGMHQRLQRDDAAPAHCAVKAI